VVSSGSVGTPIARRSSQLRAQTRKRPFAQTQQVSIGLVRLDIYDHGEFGSIHVSLLVPRLVDRFNGKDEIVTASLSRKPFY
jgi:hypothetical protein